ncbi:MAG: tRNA (uridine(34)/cytosine(34)/5-carboxymethylaminomethyluridine(34)-2'-O)-methyltransferase TrmL [Oceanospirillaceae bacterium]|jgi:tRNA (cytidine/uridine-2'-O-)-methyltransferase|uniref:tRNA (uridine(34)/cytosine(34)/5- carboxymethylaminomethyluridine(34)-2'-O)- methyltransferase TrmL n=1 Tax=Marinobacterium litorale TaxID=404770 RepID=UPI0004023521|nr:tRNA (uridine(34)/cytosine(34)/5-carboxymethylaminomethyluridine(34)-2'-O)-methyltransferase TrmL [Marinobacterium litorale]MBS98167.1 tRNA (uridine(34)/cytosine(34)/5-carboxymethylaminomethyluridine(34)-2'-O)-methyltransferase TrmL [Oceanospirillaceae bacterium]
MLDVVLYQPEIPPNTGNIIRLCANTGYRLHLIEPLGFELDDKRLRRAGLDYHEFAAVRSWPDLDSCLESVKPGTVWALTTKAQQSYSDATFAPGDMLLFGPETRGLPASVRERFQGLRLPMLGKSRSLNLSNACAVVVYESWRQLGFVGAGG